MSDNEFFVGYDHVAYATRDTDATVKLLEALGFTVKIYKEKIEKFNVYVTKMVSKAKHVAEIVEPVSSPSVVSELLGDRDATVYHTCFQTDDFDKAREKMKKAGAVTITKPMRIPYPITEAHKSYFASHMYHPNLGLFEITGPIRESKE
jgi:4-hydroxyphenylpyruvate dioxygenase-like putative hemolysin